MKKDEELEHSNNKCQSNKEELANDDTKKMNKKEYIDWIEKESEKNVNNGPEGKYSKRDAGDKMKSESDNSKKDSTKNIENKKSVNADCEEDIRNRRQDDLEEFVASEDMLHQINKDLARQVCDEMTTSETKAIDTKKKFPKWAKITSGILGGLLCLVLIFVGTPWGRSKVKKLAIYIATEYAYGKMDYDDGKDVIAQVPTEDVVDKAESPDASLNIHWNNSGYVGNGARREDYVINVLLLGEEAIGSGTSRGRTDVMMIASMNTKDKSLKLTSLMRDTLVQIPEFEGKSYRDNKLNVAYEIGGVQLLYETIANNLDIALDGYALVGFDSFETIVDILGGVKVTLSASEARYLNTTNYISNKSYRNVIAGTQVLNGNQAVGFCRIRHVATVDNQHYDYGRTSRQRVVLNAIFDKCKSKSATDLALLMNQLLPYVKTDITKEQFRSYLEIGLSLKIQDLENARIPADGMFEEGYERGMAVLIPNLDQNIQELHKFIFGSVEVPDATQTSNSMGNSGASTTTGTTNGTLSGTQNGLTGTN